MRTLIDGQAVGAEPTAIAPCGTTRYEPGIVLSGKYRLETLLGEGGMGAVWRANNVLLDLPVAIKLIRADLDRGALRARLRLEARSAAKLGHPSIVRVFDVGESEFGDPFIVMEHLRGETLAQMISRGPLPAARAVQLLLPIIDALAVAHSRGIVHRDLKPDNVMLALQEQQHICPKILDFGIAKLTDPHDSDLKLTEFGAVVGSPEYMSPEQARGRDDIDASTDIWSTCVVLYEAVTGVTPFSASNFNALLRRIVEDAPKPLFEHAIADAELWQILERGLQKDRALRYRKISELGQALASWLVAQGVAEDASGSSLDCKWFGRKSDPSNLGVADNRATSSSQPGLRESSPDSTGIARGPFTKTIPPNIHGRTRTLGAVAVGCILFAFSWFALGRSPHATESVGQAPAAAATRPVVDSESNAPANVLPDIPNPVQEAPIAAPETTAPPVSEAKPRIAPVRVARAAANSPRPSTLANVPVTANVPVATPKSERPLDLLPPY